MLYLSERFVGQEKGCQKLANRFKAEYLQFYIFIFARFIYIDESIL